MMLRYTEQQIAEVKARTSLAALIGARVRLAKKGRELEGLCPFHNEKTPSFYVVEGKGFYHCFGCGAHGNCFSWMEHFFGLGFRDAVLDLGARAGLWSGGADTRQELAPIVAQRDPEEDAREAARKSDDARRLYFAALPPAGTPVAVYWRARALGEQIPETIRYMPSLPYWQYDETRGRFVELGRFPAMLTPMSGDDRRVIAVHRTYLAPGGRDKAKVAKAKKLLGRPGNGALRLTPAARIMVRGEGIETTWSGRLHKPDAAAWAAYSLGHLAGKGKGNGGRHPVYPARFLPSPEPDMDYPGMVLPPDVEIDILLRDSDSTDLPSVDMLLARAAERSIREGRRVSIVSPPDGLDMNDWHRRLTA